MANNLSDSSGKVFPLHLAPAIQNYARLYSEKEGISLNQFINVALAEKLDHLRHDEWVEQRKPVTLELREQFLALLDRAGSADLEPGDELPEGYVSPFPRSTS